MLKEFLNDSIEIEHQSRTYTYQVDFQPDSATGDFDMKAEVGDRLTRKSTGGRFVVTVVQHFRMPGNADDEMNNCKLVIMSEAAYRRQEESKAATQITQHIGTAHTVAGRDIHGGVNTTITVTQIFDALAAAIEDAEAIPAGEKASLLGKIKALATNPYVMAIAPPLIVEALKKGLGLPG